VGAGTRIRIRGANSLSLSNEPLIYIDGVKINNDDASLAIGTGGQTVSRMNDLNPEEIESIEIVKGPSAATLYGTEAANGVIRITTKRGIAGAPQWNVYAEGGILTDPNDYPDNWKSWGRAIDPATGTPGTDPGTCLLSQSAAGLCVIDSLTTFNPLETDGVTPIGRGHREQFGASVTGGTDAIQYFFSGEYENETGTFRLPDSERSRLLVERGVEELEDNVLRPNTNQKVSLRMNLNSRLSDKFDLNGNVGYISGDLRLPQNDNNVLGMLPSGYFGVASASDTVGTNGGWGFFSPGEIFSLLRQQNMERFTGSANAQWRPLDWLTGRATVGYDIGNRAETAFNPTGQGPAFGTTPLGAKSDFRTQLKTYTVDAGFTAMRQLMERLGSRTSIGVQYFKDVFFQNQATGERLAAGSEDIDGAGILTAAQTTTETVTLGAFIEQQFTIADKLFLTGAVRIDDNSSFGEDFDAIVFPKASISYLISDEGYFPEVGFLSLLRLRASYGQSGLQPGATDALTFLTPTASAVDGASTPAVTFGGLGLADLKPERSREFEIGFDAGMFNDRVSLEATYFNKRTSDALIARVLPPSLGVSNTRFENLGSVSNVGVEATVNARLVQASAISWDLTLAGSLLRNRLRELGEGIPPVVAGNFRHVPGYPLGGFWDRPILSFDDANGDGIIDVSEVEVGDTAVFIGSSQPTREASLNTVFSLFRDRLRLQGQFDYKGGFRQFNNTEVFRCTATGNNCRAMHDPDAPFDQQARAVVRRFHPTASNFGFIEDAEFLKLREVSISYTLPEGLSNRFRADRATVTLAGRNLATFTGYTGVDPEVNSQQGALNGFAVSDFLTQPPIRTVVLRLNLVF
jgi:TonB-linked SusC/RagA family outer membrane protein